MKLCLVFEKKVLSIQASIYQKWNNSIIIEILNKFKNLFFWKKISFKKSFSNKFNIKIKDWIFVWIFLFNEK